jgi:uncharacterized damage-inducible protein DinB
MECKARNKRNTAWHSASHKLSTIAHAWLAFEYNDTVKQVLTGIIAAALLSCSALQAQSANPVSTELKAAYTSVKNNLLKSAEKMPDDAYGFKPTSDIRSFAEVLDHAASAQMHTCSAVLGEQKPVNAEATSKTDVITALNAAFAECDKAYDSLTDANGIEMIKTPRGERSRLGALAGNIAHDNEQYGILSVYMRLKGVIPPSSESAARKK